MSNTDVRQIKVETIKLEDGRHAERHTTVGEDGRETVEVFAEERRPLKLETQITREHKMVVSKEIHRKMRDGEVVEEKTFSTEPDVPLQLRAHLGVTDHHKIVDGDYVRKEEIGDLISEGVVAGMAAMMEKMEPVSSASYQAPVFKAQQVVEKNVEDKKKDENTTNIVMGVIVVLQLAFFGWMYFSM